MNEGRTDWSDKRLDDRFLLMDQTIEKLSSRVDLQANVVATHDIAVSELKRNEAIQQDAELKKRDRSFELRLGLLLVFLGQLGTIVALVVPHH